MLVHEALRMSPDRIIIGEVRGGEALDLLDAGATAVQVGTALFRDPRATARIHDELQVLVENRR